ncbi:U3 small nucleolar RNA-associated protein 18 [Zancudomyces culisetae]|uniref:U3 small nucleolar RNA-associated protein 18 n=1 Tax=Zancudomyces culisetae TaxID=1213189 RepID=A0A1R1PUZ4_ZANCU|nr:U3 small nucleolar RNA-associated protein 18 [Zancudomyces culisetae]|eukprot:OMH84767.1 U3 small nucleolar RNA-associated protein 18 [Zancudomyces culisetae]
MISFENKKRIQDSSTTGNKNTKQDNGVAKKNEKKRSLRNPRTKKPNNKKLKSEQESELEKLVFGITSSSSRNNGSNLHEDQQEQNSESEREWEGQESSEDDVEEGQEKNEQIDDLGFIIDTVGAAEMPTTLTQGQNDEKITEKNVSSKQKGKKENKKALSEGGVSDPSLSSVKVSLVDKNITKKLRVSLEEQEIGGEEYEKRLRKQYTKINPTPKWALEAQDEHDQEGGHDDDEGLIFQSTRSIIDKRAQAKIGAGQTTIDISRVKNANYQSTSQATIQQLDFHPTNNVLAVGGMDKTLRLFEVDGEQNKKLNSVYFKDLPILNCLFNTSDDGKNSRSEIVLGGRRPYFYTFDLKSEKTCRFNNSNLMIKSNSSFGSHNGGDGNVIKTFENFKLIPENNEMAVISSYGQIHLIDMFTKKWKSTIRMNGNVKDVAISGNYLYGLSSVDSQLYQFDMRYSKDGGDGGDLGAMSFFPPTTTCVNKYKLKDTFKPTCISVKSNNILSVGDYSGFVNIYNLNDSNSTNTFAKELNLLKSINSLTTPITNTAFTNNNSDDLLLIYSRVKKDQLKLVNANNNYTVFSNWPTMKTPLGYVQTAKFSPNNGYLAVGNDKGHVLLYRLNAFSSY